VNLVHQLGLFVSTIQARLDRLEALLGMRSGLFPSDLLETLVDYFVMENVPISHVDEQFFWAVPYRLDPTVASHMPNEHQMRADILRRAMALRHSVTVGASSNPFMILMTDGVRKAGRIWRGICLAIVTNW
jgi:hypothetical protein